MTKDSACPHLPPPLGTHPTSSTRQTMTTTLIQTHRGRKRSTTSFQSTPSKIWTWTTRTAPGPASSPRAVNGGAASAATGSAQGARVSPPSTASRLRLRLLPRRTTPTPISISSQSQPPNSTQRPLCWRPVVPPLATVRPEPTWQPPNPRATSTFSNLPCIPCRRQH